MKAYSIAALLIVIRAFSRQIPGGARVSDGDAGQIPGGPFVSR